MKIGIGADHRGYRLKLALIDFLKKNGFETVDYGTSSEKPVDYPHYALAVAQDLVKKKIDYGILLCFSAQGMAITANKVKGIRAAICFDPEVAVLARRHNDANILVLGTGFIKSKKIWQAITKNFLSTKFEGGRHQRRLDIIKNYEDSSCCI